MKHLVGKIQTKQVEFIGDSVEIKKLPVSDILVLQKKIVDLNKKKDEMGLIRLVLRTSVIGAEELTDDDFNSFPPGDLAKLVEEVLVYCGLSQKEPVGN